MIPIKQEFRHNPPHSYGDCHRAAIASLLELALDDVPHFMEGLGPKDGEIFTKRQSEFLNSVGLDCITFPVNGELNAVFAACAAWNPNRLFLLGGRSISNVGHTVVASQEGIVHDPHPDNVGIIGPMDDGYYWLSYIVGLGLPYLYRKIGHH